MVNQENNNKLEDCLQAARNGRGMISAFSAQDIAEIFGYSVDTIKTKFDRTAEAIRHKYGVQVYKAKNRKKQIVYFVAEKTRAVSLYEEKNDIAVTLESLSFEAFEFCVFLTLSASPHGFFRGTRKELLEYIGVKNLKKNIQILNEVIQSLVQRDYIFANEDEDYIILYLKRAVQKENQISMKMLRECRRIADQNKSNFKKFVNLVKVWEAIRVCQKNQPFKYAQLAELTGLSYRQIRDIKQLLQRNDAFLSKRAGSYFKCLGMSVDLNAFVN